MERDRKDTVYRAYMTDALAAVAGNTQRFAGGQAMQRRYTEIVTPRKAPPLKSADVIARIRKKFRE